MVVFEQIFHVIKSIAIFTENVKKHEKVSNFVFFIKVYCICKIKLWNAVFLGDLIKYLFCITHSCFIQHIFSLSLPAKSKKYTLLWCSHFVFIPISRKKRRISDFSSAQGESSQWDWYARHLANIGKQLHARVMNEIIYWYVWFIFCFYE